MATARTKTLPSDPDYLSVSQMAARVGLSRRRFYELVESGKMPPPCYRLADRRPVYPSEVQQMCVRVKTSGLAFDGAPILFNTRGGHHPPSRRRPGRDPAPTKGGGELAELVEQLGLLGLPSVKEAAVEHALEVCCPSGLNGLDRGVILKALVRHFRRGHRH